jgi:hypothetical protein
VNPKRQAPIELEEPRDELDRVARDDHSNETFDRMTYAQELLSMLRPRDLRVVLGRARYGAGVHVDAGRRWGHAPQARWALLTISQDASRRAIARAILALATESAPPYSVDYVAWLAR